MISAKKIQFWREKNRFIYGKRNTEMIFVQIGKFHFDIQKRNLEPIFAKPQTLQNRQQKKKAEIHTSTQQQRVYLHYFRFN